MSDAIFVLGGCRSGKSGHALALANNMPGTRKLFVATCTPHDDEMARRVAKHQAERGDDWETLEVPVAVARTIREQNGSADVILVDCLTLWISNLMTETRDPDVLSRHIADLADAVAEAACPVILVSNEVGAGIVPENRLARAYRDLAGQANQAVAAVCRTVIWTVAGIPVTIKPAPPGP